MATTKWALDASHSEIQFKVKHMMISTVSGEFTKFDAGVETEGDDFTTAKIHFSADVASINTKNEQRDQHLHSPDFFDAPNHPQITFNSEGMTKKDDEHYELTGKFTMRSVTKDVTFHVVFGGIINDPFGHQRAGFEVSSKINRKDFGVQWSAVTEAGGLVVSDEVRLFGNLEFVKI